MKNTKILVAQLGARKHYQEPLLFHHWGILDRLYTDFYSGHSSVTKLLQHPKIYNYLPNIIKKSLDRYEPQLKNATIIHFPLFAYQYLQALKKASSDKTSEIFIWSGQEFCQQIIKYGLGNANVIYGFNSACLELFEYAKSQGIYCILDQTLADYSLVYQLLTEEDKIWTEWSLTPFTVNQGDLKLMEREHQEQDLADHIICGSNFVKDSLITRGVDAQKVSVVPLGRLKDNITYSDPPIIQTPLIRGDGLRILFVGSVNLRKGIPYLLEALRQIKGQIPFTCKIVGSLEIKPERLAEYRDVCDFIGRIPRSQIKDLYTWADVLVLPSLCEGSAMVTYEALSLGVPIITTYHSGSIVRDGQDGFIIPIRNSKAIGDKLITSYQKRCYCQETTKTQDYLKFVSQDSESKLRQLLTLT
ncbi:glycosyl transferase group 1 (plasmid) [Gloeothece citriformis PCC 7424]|uniref:Glycosyl transferase group 1 n=1 Tax=Gloeothece citriformis (strain PCC 7424) TaxID=65393 RepID=B7KM28_GLOC7|nr:glycosyltransferase family 4 protein [Gloeothece citriformis]ACK73850.1 glycosyl transferase group 1 [Gloeothece citriformis PCC 7424]